MHNSIIVLICLCFLIANVLIGHFFPPYGILLSPIILVIIASFLGFSTFELKSIWKSLLMYSFLGISDIGIRLYAGGIHDNEGNDLISIFFLMSFLLSFIILSISIIRQNEETKQQRMISIIILLALTCIHANLFGNLGNGLSI